MSEEAVRDEAKKDEDKSRPLGPDDLRARDAVRALAELGALKLCLSCGRDSDRILQPVIYGDDLLNRGPILPLVCADCGHITTYGIGQTLSAAAKRKKSSHG